MAKLHRFTRACAGNLHPAGNHFGVLRFQPDPVIRNEPGRRADKGDLARQAAVIPPVGVERRHIFPWPAGC